MQSGTETATPTGTPAGPLDAANDPLIRGIERAVAEFVRFFAAPQTIENRLVLSAAVLAVAVTVAAVFAPRGITRIARVFRQYALEREAMPEEVRDYDYVVAVSIAARSVQAVVFGTATIALLLTWGYDGVAASLLAVLGGTLPAAGRILLTLLLIGGALVGTDVLEAKMQQFAAESTRITRHQQGILFQTIRLSALIAVGLAVLTIWGVNLSGLLVGAGFLGIVVGLAARQTLGSLIAGFVIMFARPFELGDWIQVGEIEGVVTDITINNTRLRTAAGDTVVLPNDTVSNSTIINHTAQNRLRLSVDVGVDYSTDIDRAVELALEAIDDCDETLGVPSPQVLPKAFGDSAVVLECRFWINNPSARTRALAIAAVVRAIKQRFEAEGVKIPFPQRELSGRADGLRVAQSSPTTEDATISSEDDD